MLSLPRAMNLCAIESDGVNATAVTIVKDGEAYRLLSRHHIDLQNSNGNGNKIGWIRKTPVSEVVTGRDIFMKTVELPQMPENEILETLRYTERDSAPFRLSHGACDTWALDNNNGDAKMKIMMAAMCEKELARRKELAKKSGFRLSCVSTGPAALGAIVRHSKKLSTDSPTLFIYLNETVTGICVFKNCIPIFTRELFFGAFDNSNGYAAQLEKVAKEISKSLDYFMRSSGVHDIKEGYIIGKGATIENIETFMEKWTGVAMKVYDPFDDFLLDDLKPDIKSQMSGPQIALCVGAALDKGDTINLMRGTMTPQRIKKGYAAVAATILLLLISMVTAQQISTGLDTQIKSLRAEAQSLEKNRTKNKTLLRKLVDITANNSLIKSKINAYPSFNQNKYDWLNIFQDIAAIMPANGKLTKWAIDLDEKKKNLPATENVSFHGVVKGTSAERITGLSALLASLNKSRHFESVSLKRTGMPAKPDLPNDQMVFEIKSKLSTNVTRADQGLQ